MNVEGIKHNKTKKNIKGAPPFIPITRETLPPNYFISANTNGPIYLIKMPEGILYEAPYLGAGFHQIQNGITSKNVSKRVPNFYNTAEIQIFCMTILTRLDTILYDLNVENKYKLFDFYLKGGNTMALHLPTLSYNTFFPYDFQGDFDCSLLIYPELDDKEFIKIRNSCINTILSFLKEFISIESTWAGILPIYNLYGLKPTPSSKPITVFNEALTEYDFQLSETLYESPTFRSWVTPEHCPFRLEVHPNLTSHKVPLNIGLIKLKTNTEPSLDLIDIAIPTKLYKHLNLEWDIHKTNRFILPKYKLAFNVSDILSSYLDQTIASILETNITRKQKRLTRASKLRNRILPLIQSRTIPTHNIEYLKRLPHKIDKNPNQQKQTDPPTEKQKSKKTK